MAKNYVDNVKFTTEVIKYTDAIRLVKEHNKNSINQKKLPRMTDYVGETISKISTSFAFASIFVNSFSLSIFRCAWVS